MCNRLLVAAALLAACQTTSPAPAATETKADAKPFQSCRLPLAAPPGELPTPPKRPPPPDPTGPEVTLTDTAGGGTASPEPSLADATRGLRGKGPLVAKLDITGVDVQGTLTCTLFDKQAPKTVANFVALARGLRPFRDPSTGQWVKRPLYDGTTFHRVIPQFMIQGGDPEGSGRGGPGFAFADEIDPDLRFDRPGLLAMANKGPGTNGSQFFVTEAPTPWLDGHHTIFGLCAPVDLVKKIARVPTGGPNRPLHPVTLAHVTLARGR